MAFLYLPKWTQFHDDSGNPLNGGKLYFYTTGTTTPKDTYTTEALSVANTNPVVLDADGRSATEVWISGRYRLIVKTSADVTISDDDPIEDPVPASDAQDSTPTYGGNNSGTANALVFTFSPAITTATAGQVLRGRITADNSSTVTINWGAGVKSLVKQDGTALSAGDIQGPGIIEWTYDATSDVARLTSPDGHLFRNGRNEPGMVDITDGATLDLSPATINSRYARAITSTTTVTAITLPDGNVCKVRFNTARGITHSSSLILPGSVSITTAAGDVAEFVGESGGVVRCTQYLKATGGGDGLLSTTTASAAASADITLPAGFRYYSVVFDATVSADGDEILLRIGTGAGPTFQSGASDYEFGYSFVQSNGTPTDAGSTGTTAITIGVNVGNAATESIGGDVRIHNPASTALHKIISFNTANWDNTATPLFTRLSGGGAYKAAATAITGLQFLASSGTITGTFKLYGYA